MGIHALTNDFRAIEFALALVVCLDLCTLAVFTRYLWNEFRRFGIARFRLQAAVSIWLRTVGNCVVVGWAWYYFNSRAEDRDLDWIREHPAPLIGLAVLALGALWKIRVFTPEECGHASWILSGGFALLVAFVLGAT